MIKRWGTWSPEVLEEALALSAWGLSYAQIVEQLDLGVHPETLARRLRKARKEGVAAASVRDGDSPVTKSKKGLRQMAFRWDDPEVYDPSVDAPKYHRPGSQDFLGIPSRLGGKLYYRDGRVESAT